MTLQTTQPICLELLLRVKRRLVQTNLSTFMNIICFYLHFFFFEKLNEVFLNIITPSQNILKLWCKSQKKKKKKRIPFIKMWP